MRKIKIIIILILLGSTLVKATEDTIVVEHYVKNATIYLKGAMLSSICSAQLRNGTIYLHLKNLPPELDSKSIQVECDKEVVLLSVSHQKNFLQPVLKKDEIIVLEKRKKTLDEEIALRQSLIFVYKQEEDLILSHKSLSSQSEGVKVDELKKAADFYRERLTEIRMKQLEINREVLTLTEERNKIDNQLKEKNVQTTKPVSEVFIKLQASRSLKADIVVKYLVSEAGWMPKYDLRAKNVTEPIELTYKADVWQNTGYDWKNVQIQLSTGEPLRSGTKPTLNTWNVPGGFNQNIISGAKSASTLFNITNPYSIPSDKKNYTVEVTKYSINSSYQYSSVPKMDEDAFLISKIGGWEKYYLLNGEVNLFFEGTYVGKSMLNVGTTDDTLQFSLGRDKNVIVSREQYGDYISKQLIGSKRFETYGYEINVRNNKAEAIRLEVEDQIPVSTNKSVEVNLDEQGGAIYDEKTGKLKWIFNLKPSESKKVKFKFTLKLPKDALFY